LNKGRKITIINGVIIADKLSIIKMLEVLSVEKEST